MPAQDLSALTYASVDEFRRFIKDPSTLDPDNITLGLLSASREVEAYCGRKFYQQENQVQYFSPESNQLWILGLDDMDLATTDGLVVTSEYGNDGTYPIAWTFGTDFIAEPINQSVDGIEGWPFTSLRAIGGKVWPPRYLGWYRDTVKITGTWGWPAVPTPVKESTLMLAVENLKSSDAPFGVAGFGAFGAVRVRDNPKVAMKLRPYTKHTKLMMA